jgi:hypothetical protein
LALAALTLLSGATLQADRALNGPGRPVPAPVGRTDAELAEKATRLQARMPGHLSPEGLLAYEHRVGGTPEQLSEDVLKLSDAAIWTGCYAAAQACRWHVTRDPAALEELRRLAGGLALLAKASGRPGGLVRNVGRPLPGSSGFEKSEPSPMGEGYWCRGDVSRDQLAGVTLGWAAIGRFVEDPALREQARSELAALARRLRTDRMWLRDLRGKKTEYGELREDVEGLPFTKNGRHAAIGLAPVVAAAALDPAPDLHDHLRRLLADGWGRALPEQFAWLPPLQSPSSVNMGFLALLTCRLMDRGIVAAKALEGLGMLRVATRGWWNGGYCGCLLLGGLQHRRAEVRDELRAVLHLMTEDEVPFAHQVTRQVSFIPTIVQRGNTHWTWKDQLGLVRDPPAPGAARAATTYTRADWLFAYWLARAGGELDPAPAGAPAGR